jgi:hypothetical protein
MDMKYCRYKATKVGILEQLVGVFLVFTKTTPPSSKVVVPDFLQFPQKDRGVAAVDLPGKITSFTVK